jgi:hypothetical protein
LILTDGYESGFATAALMLGTDKSRGYCLEMICADFLAGANLENEDPAALCGPCHGSSNFCLATNGSLSA